MKKGKIRQNWIKPNMALREIHFFAFVKANRLREKRKEERKRRRRRKKRRRKRESKDIETIVWKSCMEST